jgi:hypothetical protein
LTQQDQNLEQELRQLISAQGPTTPTAPPTQPTPSTPTQQPSAILPNTVGQCITTSVKEVYPYKSNAITIYGGGRTAIVYTAKDPNVPDTIPEEFTFGYQVSDEDIPGIDSSDVGDGVLLCVKSVPDDCPTGDTRGTVYHVTNLRTHQSWDAANSTHLCGGN